MDATTWTAVVSAAIALGAASTSFFQVRIMREQTRLQEQTRRDAVEPNVWVDYRIDPANGWIVDLVIRNEGPTVARNVRLTADPPIKRAREGSWPEDPNSTTPLPAFISAMPPGREIRYTLGAHHVVWDSRALWHHHIKIRYDGPYGAVTPLEYDLNFEEVQRSSLKELGTLALLTDAVQGVDATLKSSHSVMSSALETFTPKEEAPRDPRWRRLTRLLRRRNPTVGGNG